MNAIAAGVIQSEESQAGTARYGFDVKSAWEKNIPLQRLGTNEDIANLILFLASDKASGFVHGATIYADGTPSLHRGGQVLGNEWNARFSAKL